MLTNATKNRDLTSERAGDLTNKNGDLTNKNGDSTNKNGDSMGIEWSTLTIPSTNQTVCHGK